MKPTKDMTFAEMATELDTLRGAVSAPKGPRAICVVDRGWIFAGDVSETPDGSIRLDRAVWVFRWESVGFDGMIRDWKSNKVTIKPCDAVEIPKNSLIFKVPVANDWGIK